MTRIAIPALVLLLAAAARAELAEPDPNEAATEVVVEGTVVRAEARLVAKGHELEALVVAKLEPAKDEDGDPTVTTYERWSRDGRKRFSRGDAALGREWDRLARRLLKRLEEEGVEVARKGGALERLRGALGARGARTVGDRVIGWSIGHGESNGGGRASTGRVAVITIRPGPGATTPPEDDRAVTPGGEEPRRRRARVGTGSGSSSASGLARSSASSERGVELHARQVVDLGEPLEALDAVTPRPR